MLTYRDEVGGVRIEGCNSENEVEKIKSCVERLNDYERIGLTPGQVRTLMQQVGCRFCAGCARARLRGRRMRMCAR